MEDVNLLGLIGILTSLIPIGMIIWNSAKMYSITEQHTKDISSLGKRLDDVSSRRDNEIKEIRKEALDKNIEQDTIIINMRESLARIEQKLDNMRENMK
jgi:uncharacterized protein (DUF342 family)